MPLLGHLRSLLGRKNRVPELSALQGTQAESLVEAVRNSDTPGTGIGTGTVTTDERDSLIETKLRPRRSRHVNSEDFQHAIDSITEDFRRLEDQLKQIHDRLGPVSVRLPDSILEFAARVDLLSKLLDEHKTGVEKQLDTIEVRQKQVIDTTNHLLGRTAEIQHHHETQGRTLSELAKTIESLHGELLPLTQSSSQAINRMTKNLDESVAREQELLAVIRDMKKWVFIAVGLGGLAALIALVAALMA